MLTPKQEKFCLVYLETGNASEAYRQSYNPKNWKPETVHRAAKRNLELSKIRTRINELQAPAIKKAELTVENHLNKLQEIRDAAYESGNYTAATRAEELRGKVAGYYTDRIELNNMVRMVVLDD